MSGMSPDHLFLRACRREPVERTPIWMMRQAGRYLPAYRAVRARASFLDLCRNPDLACEVTLQPIDEFGFDAAILFSDILITLPPMGLEVAFPESGPKIATKRKAEFKDDGYVRTPEGGYWLRLLNDADGKKVLGFTSNLEDKTMPVSLYKTGAILVVFDQLEKPTLLSIIQLGKE